MTGTTVTLHPYWHKQNQCVMNQHPSTSISGKPISDNHAFSAEGRLLANHRQDLRNQYSCQGSLNCAAAPNEQELIFPRSGQGATAETW
jgi:hypothetical protein